MYYYAFFFVLKANEAYVTLMKLGRCLQRNVEII